ncbi:MAG: hypothetical protein ACTMUB_03865 [cyanobacterium endosymbiont of Rhopalodia musculus]
MCDIIPSKAIQDSMELQMVAKPQKRAAILSSESQQNSNINLVQRKAKAMGLEVELSKLW